MSSLELEVGVGGVVGVYLFRYHETRACIVAVMSAAKRFATSMRSPPDKG